MGVLILAQARSTGEGSLAAAFRAVRCPFMHVDTEEPRGVRFLNGHAGTPVFPTPKRHTGSCCQGQVGTDFSAPGQRASVELQAMADLKGAPSLLRTGEMEDQSARLDGEGGDSR